MNYCCEQHCGCYWCGISNSISITTGKYWHKYIGAAVVGNIVWCEYEYGVVYLDTGIDISVVSCSWYWYKYGIVQLILA